MSRGGSEKKKKKCELKMKDRIGMDSPDCSCPELQDSAKLSRGNYACVPNEWRVNRMGREKRAEVKNKSESKLHVGDEHDATWDTNQ